MSFWERIFKRREAVTRAKLFIEPTTGFSSYGGDAYANDVYREAVDAIARNAGKLKGSHVISYADHNRVDGDCTLPSLPPVSLRKARQSCHGRSPTAFPAVPVLYSVNMSP